MRYGQENKQSAAVKAIVHCITRKKMEWPLTGSGDVSGGNAGNMRLCTTSGIGSIQPPVD